MARGHQDVRTPPPNMHSSFPPLPSRVPCLPVLQLGGVNLVEFFGGTLGGLGHPEGSIVLTTLATGIGLEQPPCLDARRLCQGLQGL